MTDIMKFIADHNVGKLVGWLRMMGYDTIFFTGSDDARMIALALAEGRVILTRDSKIMDRRVVTQGRVKAVLIKSDEPEQQARQLMDTLNLDCTSRRFTICLVCNSPLEERTKQEVQDRVPPYVFQTQERYMECASCHRIYWKGTHWQAMNRKMAGMCGG